MTKQKRYNKVSEDTEKKSGQRRNETNSKVEELGSTRGITQDDTEGYKRRRLRRRRKRRRKVRIEGKRKKDMRAFFY